MMAKKISPWMEHLMKYKKAHPKKTLTECMKLAAVTYKK